MRYHPTMIIDRIENAALYGGLGERIALALASVRTRREPGRYELDGEKVVALVQQYHTRPRSEGKWEAHRKHIDVQYVAAGIEQIGWANIHRLQLTEPYDASKDVAFYQGEGDFLTVPAGWFVILFPEDAHMPCTALDKPAPVTKVVVKVRIA